MLNKSELESIRQLSGNARNKKLAETVLAHVKRANPNTSLTADTVMRNFDMPKASTPKNFTVDNVLNNFEIPTSKVKGELS